MAGTNAPPGVGGGRAGRKPPGCTHSGRTSAVPAETGRPPCRRRVGGPRGRSGGARAPWAGREAEARKRMAEVFCPDGAPREPGGGRRRKARHPAPSRPRGHFIPHPGRVPDASGRRFRMNRGRKGGLTAHMRCGIGTRRPSREPEIEQNGMIPSRPGAILAIAVRPAVPTSRREPARRAAPRAAGPGAPGSRASRGCGRAPRSARRTPLSPPGPSGRSRPR